MDISRKELAVGGSSRPIALHLTDMGCFSVRPYCDGCLSFVVSSWHVRVRVCPTWEVECLSLAKAWKHKVGIGGFKPAAESY